MRSVILPFFEVYMFKRYIGDRNFYRNFLIIALPMIIQNGITNFVSLLDNIMVGQIGTIPMSGVSIVNQLMFVFNLCIFGASSGAGIFTAQYHGSGDHAGVRYTFRYKMLICLLLSLVGLGVLSAFSRSLIGLYLTGEGDPQDAALALEYGLSYLRVMLLGLLPFALANAYSSTLRETGQTVVPMAAGIAAVLVNLGLNYVLIFGHFGAPKMGVKGAALATVISRYAELAIVAGWTHLHSARNPFIQGAYRSVYIPRQLFRRITVKGMPLLLNEFLWSTSVAVLQQCYSTCGLDVVPAMNIASTLQNLGNVVYLSSGNAVGILMGQMLGAGTPENILRDTNRKLVTASVASGVVFGGVVASLSGVFPLIYNTTGEVRALAGQLILVAASVMPFCAYANASYFTLRSGGQAMITFLFDSCFAWVVSVPLALVLSRLVGLPIVPLFLLCQYTELIKCFLGAYMLKKGLWIRNLVQA